MKGNISRVCQQENRNQSKKEGKRNTTPLLPVKTPISQGAFAIVSIIGGATTRARVKDGEQWGDVTRWRDQRRGNGGVRTTVNGGRGGSRDDDWSVVMGRMWKANCWGGLRGWDSGRRR